MDSIHVLKDNELATLRKGNKCFYWLLSGLHIAMTAEVALKISKKYESVRLYLHWPNVPTLTLYYILYIIYVANTDTPMFVQMEAHIICLCLKTGNCKTTATV